MTRVDLAPSAAAPAGESEVLEHKLSLNEWREVGESVAAFATAGGGTVAIGIEPSGRCVGAQLGSRTLENLADQISEVFERTKREAQRDLALLVNLGLLVRRGGGRSTRYELP